MSQNPTWIVCKFGGTSVSSVDAWRHIKTICEQHLAAGLRPLLVCSAASQVSNKLEALLDAAKSKAQTALLGEITTVYKNLANELDVDFQVLEKSLSELTQLCEGIALLNEVSPRVHARVLAHGELLLTQLGQAFLQQQGLNSLRIDARDYLKCQKQGLNKNYLSAQCDTEQDTKLINSLNTLEADVLITQGFIASNQQNETVLLGRGGSDTSAAYFSAKLNASACEIWTDVPGVYTANPKFIPEARLLTHLDYDEVQEIASVGGKVLHPNCIEPLRQHRIPLFVKYTQKPEHVGSAISCEANKNDLPIKSVITQYQVYLISIDSVRMWQHAGFLADVFSCFKKYDVSVDLISTSETNVSVSLDPLSDNGNEKIAHLLEELNTFAKAQFIGPCASISLVGRNIRSILPQVSDLFSVFESQQIHLLSQAANDLNLTFVVNEDQAEKLAKKLHVILIEQNPKSYYLSKSWLEEFGELETIEQPWWHQKKKALLALDKTPAYIYDNETLTKNANSLLSCKNINNVFFAIKANPHAEILKLFYELGINFECVSMGEVQHVRSLFPNINPKRILFTPNFAGKEEYVEALKLGIHLTIDSLYPLKHWSKLFSGHQLMLRIDPGHGDGHHKYVCTGGTESKFGIPIDELETVTELLEKHDISVVGLHTHSGSGILQSDSWYNTALRLSKLLETFPEVTHIDIGGGLGIVEKPGQKAIDIKAFDESLAPIKSAFPNLELWMEPGRYLVGNAGVILAKVTQIKHKGEMTFIGIETGMNSLIRPALYGSYHEIVNLSKLDRPKTVLANIVGPICESGDTLGYSRMLPETNEGDVLLIATAGAYGHCMASSYNKRAPAEELMLS